MIASPVWHQTEPDHVRCVDSDPAAVAATVHMAGPQTHPPLAPNPDSA